ncbi:MAG: NAD-dependent epimerase/dehydratase family protein, partial [Caldimonas sp.]
MRAQQVLVTGASGFVAGHLIRRLAHEGRAVRAASRGASGPRAGETTTVRMGDYADPDLLVHACEGIDTVFHLAGRAHVVDRPGVDSRALFGEANVEATRRL